MIGNGLGAQIGLPNLLHDFVEQVGIVELADKVGKLEVLKNLTGIFYTKRQMAGDRKNYRIVPRVWLC